MKEIWRKHPKFFQIEISNLGNVRSTHTGIVKKPVVRNRYLFVRFKVDNKSLCKPIHKLVIQTFIGYQQSMTVDHINGNRFDNRVDNLTYITFFENQKRANHKVGNQYEK